jgi:uncharacterized protein (DUF305 family)
MNVFPVLGSLLLVAGFSMATPAPEQVSKPGVIPLGLADGPYVHVMAKHHEEAIRIANLAATKATSASVKTLAKNIVGNQQKELAELKQFMTTVAEDMAPSSMAMMKKMPVENLDKASGAGFDRLFLDMMIEHHQDALTMTRAAKLVMPGVQAFARRTTERQEAELKELQALRKQLG